MENFLCVLLWYSMHMKVKPSSSKEPNEEYKRFEELARRLVRVPKKEIDKQIEKDSRSKQRQEARELTFRARLD